MKRRFRCASALIVVLALAPITWAGPGHQEVDDAGGTKGSAQTVSGTGPLNSIEGNLTGTAFARAGLPDFEDMYLIRISNPEAFSARTDLASLTDFDTQLFLFTNGTTDAEVFGIVANDEDPGGVPGSSLLLRNANDGSAATIPGPGLYLLAISGFNNDPVSSGGLIFNQQLREEISGPDGPGGTQSHAAWSGTGDVGHYFIELTGVEFVPPIPTMSEWGLLVMALLLVAAGSIVVRYRARSLAPVRVKR